MHPFSVKDALHSNKGVFQERGRYRTLERGGPMMQNCKGKHRDNSCAEDAVSSQGAGAGGGGMPPGNKKGN